MDFLSIDFSKPPSKIIIDGGERDRRVPKPVPVAACTKDEEEDDVEFTMEFIAEKTKELAEELAKKQERPYNASVLTSYDPISGEGLDATKSLEAHEQYLTVPNKDTVLPIFAEKQNILNSILHNQVTIINGGTGCGKTTQVPQYVLDDCYDKRAECNIIVTQPRRLAATSIAHRVCEERGWPMGKICGYQIGQDQLVSEDTRILYCTTGILLQKLIFRRTLSDYTHIFLDEVHERSQDMDFLLLLIRLHLRDSKTKIILMSATMENKMFILYFKQLSCVNTKVVEIYAPARFEVETYYLDDLHNGQYSMNNFDHGQKSEIFRVAIEACLSILKSTEQVKKSSVLIFLPGLMEIRDLYQKLLQMPGSADWKIFMLHSSVPSDEQALIMRRYEAKYRKIILATNIAESSITVPDVEIVIDFCLTKRLRFDRESESCTLTMNWISSHEGTQRAGRVGRVGPGRVYRLVPAAFYMDFAERSNPEMLEAPIETTVLRAKSLRLSDPVSILSQAIEPPRKYDIRHAVKLLKEAGALTYTVNGVYVNDDGDMTFLGNIMSRLPLDYLSAKLVALGYACGVLEDAAIVAAYITFHRLFLFPMDKEMEAYRSLRTWADNSQSDAIAALTVFKEYQSKYAGGDLTRGEGQSAKQWTKQCYVQLKTLKEMSILVDDIMKRMQSFTADLPIEFLSSSDKHLRTMILKFVIAGAFYGSYFIASSCETEVDALRELNDLNPLQTVVFKGFPRDQIGEVYTRQIQNFFTDCYAPVKPYVSFYCERVLVEFPGAERRELKDFGVRYEPIRLEVYMALYKKKIRHSLVIQLLNSEDNQKIAEEYGLKVKTDFLGVKKDPEKGDHRREVSNLPSVNVSRIYLHIVKFINPGHFMAAYDNFDDDDYRRFEGTWSNLEHKQLNGRPGIGCVYLFKRGGVCVRARVEEVYERTHDAQVLYIDIGNRVKISIAGLLVPHESVADMVYNTPAYVFECRLSNIEPVMNEQCVREWTPKSIREFKQAIDGALLNAVVYSVVDGVVRLQLLALKNQEEICINDLLVKKQLAVVAPEGFRSEKNHGVRSEQRDKSALEYYAYEQRPVLRMPEKVYPDLEKKHRLKKVTLSGPTSPLLCKMLPIHDVNRDYSLYLIARDSVNAVVLNTCPEDTRSMLLIGHGRSFRNQSAGVSIKTCTLMPDIRGLQCLIPVLFAPRVQLRADPLFIRYTSALCGMGTKEDGTAIYPENDFNVVFDTEFTNKDLDLVNEMRSSISSLLYTRDESMTYANYSQPEYVAGVKKIQASFSGLLVDQKERQSIHPHGELKNWEKNLTVKDDRILYPVHKALKLRNKADFVDCLKKMYQIHKREIAFEPCRCVLCDQDCTTRDELVKHVMSYQHQKQEDLLLK